MKSIGVLFDLDGVLIDSETEYSRIWAEVHRRFPTGTEDFTRKIKGMTLDNILATYFGHIEDHQQIRDTLYELEGQMTYEWLPGAREFVEWLISENIPRALVTSSDNKKMAHLRSELPELEPMMTVIVTADKISKSKPDPEGYLLAAKLLGLSPQNCAVCEDSLQGVKAGKASGAFTIGVAGTLPAATIAPYCNMVINNFDELDKNIILNLGDK